AEHVLLAPTVLKNPFFGYDYADDASGGVYTARKRVEVGKIENPVSSSGKVSLTVNLNAGLLRGSNLVQGQNVMQHVAAWAQGGIDGQIVQRSDFGFNAVDERCESELEMRFALAGEIG
ncbi:unnamed protein product, partial [Amoebophrya sp. A25]